MNDDVDKMMQRFDPAVSAPVVTPRADDEVPRQIMVMGRSNGTDDGLVPPSVRRRVWAAVIAGAVVLALLIAGGLFLSGRPGTPSSQTVTASPGRKSDNPSQTASSPAQAQVLRLVVPADSGGAPELDGCVPSWNVWVSTDPPGGPGEGNFGELHPPLTLVADAQVDDSIVGLFTSTAGTAICVATPNDEGGYTYVFAFQKEYLDPAAIQASPDTIQLFSGPLMTYWQKWGDAIEGDHVFMAGGLGANVTSVAVNLSDQTSVTAKIKAPYWIAVYPSATADGTPVQPVSLTGTMADGTIVTTLL